MNNIMVKENFILICPKCCSTDVKTDFSNAGMVATGMFKNEYICNYCGYSGEFFPEIKESELEEYKKENCDK